jgi:uncharacterized protein with beta-barrel porin domain
MGQKMIRLHPTEHIASEPGVARRAAFARLLLASSSIVAMIAAGATPAFASCTTFNGVSNTGVTNSSAIQCIDIENGSVISGNVTNTSGATITASGAVPSRTAITINNSAVTGAVSNAGAITASGGTGIFVTNEVNNNAVVTGIVNAAGGRISGVFGIAVQTAFLFGNSSTGGGITNAGTITASETGISVTNVTALDGVVSNNGTITATRNGIVVSNITQFGTSVFGGITNSGTITSTSRQGIEINLVSTVNGNIANTGTISSRDSGIALLGIGQFSGSITNGGTISAVASGIYAAAVTTFAGGITNSGLISSASLYGIYVQAGSLFTGGIVNNSSGTISAAATGIRVDSVSSFIGGIVNMGTISGATGIVVANTGAVSVFDSGVIVGTGGTAVNMSGNAAGNTFTLGPGYNITGNVLGAGADTFQLGGNGSGNFNLATIGAAQQYRGFTTFNIVSGVWDTTGTFGQAQAWNIEGGTLAGTGTFNSIYANAGGTLAPGTPGVAGTVMSINGNLTLRSGATYLVYLNPATASLASVNGAAALAGSVQANFATGSYVSKTYTILTATGGVSGTFSGITNVNLPAGTSDTLSYDANDVYLNLAPGFSGLAGLTTNQKNVANALTNVLDMTGGLPDAFFSLSKSGLTQVNGEAATDAGKGADQLMNDFLNLMLDPTAGGGSAASGGGAAGFAPEQNTSLPDDVALAYAKALRQKPQSQQPQSFDQRWTAWGSAFGGTSFTNGNAATGSNYVTASDYGFAAGMDYHATPDFTYGFALAGGGTNWNLAQGLGSGRSDSFQAGLYAKTHAGPAYVSAALAFANNWFTTDRIALSDQLKASFTGQSYAARLEGGYRYAVPITGAIVGVTPYAALQAQDFHTPSYSETDVTGGGFGLSYASMNATDTRSELGARFDNLQVVSGMPLILRGRLAWAHDWYTNASALNAAFETLPGSNFTVNGAAPPKNSALTTAAAELHITSNWTAIAKFDGDFGSGSQTYGGTGTLKYSW